MPPYEFSPYHDPYVGSIADLMQAPARAQAAAAIAKGQAWAGAAQGIGNAVSGAAQSIAQATDPRRKFEEAQLADFKARQAGGQRLDQLMQGDQMKPGDVGPHAPSYVDQNGLFDVPGLTKALADSGYGHIAPDLVKGAESINESILKHQQIQQQADITKTIMLGQMANGVLKLNQSVGMPVLGAMDFIAQSGLQSKTIKPDEYAAIKQHVASLPPDQQIAALRQMMDAAAQVAPKKTISKDAIETDIFGRTTASNKVPDKVTPEQAKIDSYIASMGMPGGTTWESLTPQQRASFPQWEEAQKPKTPGPTSESKPKRVKGVGDVPVDYIPNREGTGGKYFLNGKELTPGKDFTEIPPASIQISTMNQTAGGNLPAWAFDDSRPSGPDANKMDPKLQRTPNAIYQDAMTLIQTGQYPRVGIGNNPIANAVRSAIESKAGAIAAASGMDIPALRAFYKANQASLTQQQKASDAVQGFMATADRNADLLKGTMAKLPDIGSPIFNKPMREFAKSVAGDTNMSQFATYMQSVQNEYARIISQPNLAGQLTDNARHEAEALIDPKATVPQILASVQALSLEGANRVLGIGQQIQRIMQRMNVTPQQNQQTQEVKPTHRFNPATGKIEEIRQ